MIARGWRLFAMTANRNRRSGDSPLRIVVIRTDGIGDVVLTTPLIRELRRQLPGCWITVVVSPAAYELMQPCVYADEVLFIPVSPRFDWPSMKSADRWRLHRRTFQFARSHLWRKRYSVALVPRWDVDAYHALFLAMFSGAGRRIGHSEIVNPWKCEVNRGFDVLLTDLIKDPRPRHEVLRNIEVLRCLGATRADASLELWTEDGDGVRPARLLQENFKDRTFVVLGIGAGEGQRVWPASHFSALARMFIDRLQMGVVLVGSVADAGAANSIIREVGSGVVSVAGQFRIRETVCLLRQARLFVGNDSGPMHMAAACKVPVVEISCHPVGGQRHHPNDPDRFGPWGVVHQVVRPPGPVAPCKRFCAESTAHCIRLITQHQVWAAVSHVMDRETAKSVHYSDWQAE